MPPPIPDAQWILGRGWNQEMWADKRFPTAADLDAVVSDRPVWLGRVDGHAAVANSAALQGGRHHRRRPRRRRAGGSRTACSSMRRWSWSNPRSPRRRRPTYDAALAKAQELMLSTGLTAAADMGTSPDDWAAMNRAGQAGTLNVRILSYAGGIPAMRAINGGKPSDWLYGDRLHLGGVKLYADGALGSRGAWLKAPYHDKPDTRGLQPDQRRRAARPDERSGGERLPAGDPRHRRCRQCPGDRRLREARRRPTRATAAGGSSMSQIARPRRPAAPEAGRDHRLDAADPPDQRPD